MANPIMRYFEYEHLTNNDLRAISAEFALLAKELDENVLDSPEKSAGLRKLLEAKDCFVRAALPPKNPSPFQ